MPLRRRLLHPILMCASVVALVLVPVGAAGAAGSAGQYDWPLQPQPAVTEQFDPPPKPWLSGHRGVDLAAADGQAVLAAGAGTVAFAGMVAGKPVVSVDHGSIRTTYEPVIASVQAGQSVDRGDQIGTIQAGHEGCAVSACLHWGAKRGETYLNPLSLLQPTVVRLLPL